MNAMPRYRLLRLDGAEMDKEPDVNLDTFSFVKEDKQVLKFYAPS